jgi:orotate phosphoribosyltransferase
MADLSDYQREFIDFLIHSEALTFGAFTTKSGRETPYFINTGNINSGPRIAAAGRYYANHIVEKGLSAIDTVFGPAYKGIPLAVATATALCTDHGIDVGFSFDRKEEKAHGDKGQIVGRQLEAGQRIVLVEDVITAGTTFRSIIPLIQGIAAVEFAGIVISVDRCERGTGAGSAIDELSETMGIPIFPIVTLHDIRAYLSEPNASGLTLSSGLQDRIDAYLAAYGV